MISKREELISKLTEYGYIKTEKVRNAMLKVPREEFLPIESKQFAYVDQPLPIGHGQTISAPHMVAMICEELSLQDEMKVLEIGTGLGYNAAVVAEIVGEKGHVFSIERIKNLARAANENLERTSYSNIVKVIVGDGTMGYKKEAPYDRIYATASAPSVPDPLKKQLIIGGKLITPIGSDHYFQELICITRTTEHEFKSIKLGGVAFVPMIGKHGWPED
jgi:protein-L-isoaspartate(D-aspartate) O-methyltransferase